MKISELEDKKGNINIDLKIIWDGAEPQERFGKTIKSVIVADADGKEGDPTAYLDLYNKDAKIYKVGDKIRIVDAYSKLILNGKGQFRITNTSKVEKLELESAIMEHKQKDDKEATKELIDKFEELCGEYVVEEIDVKMVRKGVIDEIDNFSG